MSHQEVETIVANLLDLQWRYATTYRAVIPKERYQAIHKIHNQNFETELAREPLLEHVGHLPVIATYLSPFAASRPKVSLGRVLTMLAIHDIGETAVGDTPSYQKSLQNEDKEIAAGRHTVSGDLQMVYEEYQALDTVDAKFAKSIDTLAPMLHHLSNQQMSDEFYAHDQADLLKLWQQKRKYMTWDNNLLAIYDFIADKLRSTYIKVWKPETEDE